MITKTITLKNNYNKKYKTVTKNFNDENHFNNWCKVVERYNKIVGIQ